MENEGIMGLPEGQAMQDPESSQALPAVSSADSYDAALTALGATNPGQLDVYKRAIRQEIQALDLSPAEISALVEMLEYMSQRPAEYPQLRQSLIEQDIIDAEDLPEQYDPSFIGAMLAVLSEMEMARGQGAMAPMEMGPDMAELPSMGFAEGGLADAAQYLASKGRRGDTMLAHITPAEARMLSAMGGSATINPDTGLPEFFLKKIFKGIKKAFKSIGKAVKKVLKSPIGKIIATIALATVLGPSGLALVSSKAAAAAIASGATTLAAGGSIKDALVSSAMGYFGGGGTIGGVNPVGAIAGRVGQFLPGGAEGALAQGIGTGVTGAGVGLVAGMSPEEALKMGATQGVIAGGTQAFQNWLASRQPPPAEPPVAPVEEVGTAQEQPGAEAPAPGAEAQPPAQPAPAQPAAAPAATAPVAAAPQALDTVAALNRLSDTELMIEGYQPFEIAQIRSGTFAGSFPTSPVINQAVGAAPTGGGYFNRLGQFVRQPSFENLGNLLVDKTATTTVGKYGPSVATALGATALMGGFKGQPVDEAPLFERGYTGSDFIRDNPELFQGSLAPPTFEPYNPVVPTPSYGTMPVTQPTTVVPTGVTQNPQGIVQPYNVEGLYGVPLIYPTPPRGYAEGGEANKPDMRQEFMDEAARRIRAGGITGWIPNPINSLKAMANMRLPSVERAVEQKIESRRDFPKDAFGGPGIPFRQAGYGRMYMSGFDPTSGGTYDPGSELVPTDLPPGGFAQGGFVPPTGYAGGGQPTHFPRKNGPINGPGTGTSDSIPAMLSDGEFVFTAKAVRNAGGGSRRKGAKRMYSLMKKLEGGPVEA